jgi:hypothetical protein
MTDLSKSTLRCLGALSLLSLVAMSPPPVPVSEPAPRDASEPAPATLRDTLALFAQDFDVKIVGLNRVGTEAPNWPEADLPPAEMLQWILKDYSYAAVLKPSVAESGRRLPERLFIIGEHKVPPGGNDKDPTQPTIANADRPPPASLAVWGRQPSAVVRSLTSLATSTASRTLAGASAGANSQAAAAAAPPPILKGGENPAQSAAAMAALTRSAQSSLSALVTGLRQACQNPKGC